MALVFDHDDLKQHLKKKAAEIGEENLGEYYTTRVVRKYTKTEQDENLQKIIDTILNVPGGYWQVIEHMNYLPEFEHYGMKSVLSYEKQNVPKTIAKKELLYKKYQKIYK